MRGCKRLKNINAVSGKLRERHSDSWEPFALASKQPLGSRDRTVFSSPEVMPNASRIGRRMVSLQNLRSSAANHAGFTGTFSDLPVDKTRPAHGRRQLDTRELPSATLAGV